MKKIVSVLEVLLIAIIVALMFSFYAVFWGDSLFWLRIVGTLVVSAILLRNINNVLESYIEAAHIIKTTDDIMKAFDAFKSAPTTLSEEEVFSEGARHFIIRKAEEEYIEGMSPIARHKYEKELAKRPSAKVKSTIKKKNK